MAMYCIHMFMCVVICIFTELWFFTLLLLTRINCETGHGRCVPLLITYTRDRMEPDKGPDDRQVKVQWSTVCPWVFGPVWQNSHSYPTVSVEWEVAGCLCMRLLSWAFLLYGLTFLVCGLWPILPCREHSNLYYSITRRTYSVIRINRTACNLEYKCRLLTVQYVDHVLLLTSYSQCCESLVPSVVHGISLSIKSYGVVWFSSSAQWP